MQGLGLVEDGYFIHMLKLDAGAHAYSPFSLQAADGLLLILGVFQPLWWPFFFCRSSLFGKLRFCPSLRNN